MFRVFPACFLALTLLLASCEKDDDNEGYRAAGITFRSDTGYTHTDDTVGLGDTLRIEALVAEGSERLSRLYVERAILGGATVLTDSMDFGANPTVFPIRAIVDDAPGTEIWSVRAVERDGNTTRRSLRFTVTE
ncbi:MAG TPA: hypothetical protein VGE21_10960 [Flavobacteriales bacterium]